MAFQPLFLKHVMWLHLDGPSPIQQPQLKDNDSHWCVSSEPLIEDEVFHRIVTPKLAINWDVLRHFHVFLDDFDQLNHLYATILESLASNHFYTHLRIHGVVESEISLIDQGEFASWTPKIVFEIAEWKALNPAINWIISIVILG